MKSAVELDGAPKAAPVGLDTAAVMAKAGAENFPVATRLLPRHIRSQLLAIYGYARFVDDVGDLVPGDRLAQLDWVEAELDLALAGSATHPVFVAVGRVARELGLDRDPFVDLIEANRQDQVVTRYRTYELLAEYCALSANPVGRLVLPSSAGATPPRSSSPTGCARPCSSSSTSRTSPRTSRSAASTCRRRTSPGSGSTTGRSPPAWRRPPFAGSWPSSRRGPGGSSDQGARSSPPSPAGARVTVAGFVGGGLAQLDAIERRGFDVLSAPVKASKAHVASRTLGAWALARRDRP